MYIKNISLVTLIIIYIFTLFKKKCVLVFM